jgi:hypothetical protein
MITCVVFALWGEAVGSFQVAWLLACLSGVRERR